MGCAKSSPTVSDPISIHDRQQKSAGKASTKAANESPVILVRKANNNASQNKGSTKHNGNQHNNVDDDDDNFNDDESVDSRRMSKKQKNKKATSTSQNDVLKKNQNNTRISFTVPAGEKQSQQQNSNTHDQTVQATATAAAAADISMAPSIRQNFNEESTLVGVIEHHHLADEHDETELKKKMQYASHKYTQSISSTAAVAPAFDTAHYQNIEEMSLEPGQKVDIMDMQVYQSMESPEKMNRSEIVSNTPLDIQKQLTKKDSTVAISQLGFVLNSQLVQDENKSNNDTDSNYTNLVLRQPSSQAKYVHKQSSISMQTSGQRLGNTNIIASGLDYDSKRRELLRKFSDEIEELEEIDENNFQLGGSLHQNSKHSKQGNIKKTTTQFEGANLVKSSEMPLQTDSEQNKMNSVGQVANPMLDDDEF